MHCCEHMRVTTVCVLDLVVGRQIEFRDPTLGLYQSIDAAPVRATLLRHVQHWRYLFRFHHEVHPRQREVDLARVTDFVLLRHLPLIYDLSVFEAATGERGSFAMDSDLSYDYSADVFASADSDSLSGRDWVGADRPLGIRPPLAPLRAQHRAASDYRENFFEARAVGIGAAEEEAAEQLRAELKKEQWRRLIDQRRAEQEEARKKQIEETQKQMMEENLSQQKRVSVHHHASSSLC